MARGGMLGMGLFGPAVDLQRYRELAGRGQRVARRRRTDPCFARPLIRIRQHMGLSRRRATWESTSLDDMNAPMRAGAGFLNTNITPQGTRASSARCFLRPALARSNLTLQLNAQVAKLTFKGKRCTGVS